MNTQTVEWLLQGEAWIQYRTRVDLLGQAETDPQVSAARKAMLADPKIQSLLAELTDWPGAVLNSHKSASQPFHKLAFIADLGLNISDTPIKKNCKKGDGTSIGARSLSTDHECPDPFRRQWTGRVGMGIV
jgi:hypothetical protein